MAAVLENVTEQQLTEASVALKFILAGNAYFTLRSKVTGNRFTYRFKKCKPNPRYPGDVWFISVFVGSDNTNDYRYMGTLGRRRRLQLCFQNKSTEALKWTWEKLNANVLPESLEIWHAGRCGRCGRMLTVPESIAAGIGPECADKL